MRSIQAIGVGFALAACASAAVPGPSRVAPATDKDLVALVAQLDWPSGEAPKQVAASEAGQRAIAALMKRDAFQPIALPCNSADGSDPTPPAFDKSIESFTYAVVGASSGPDDPKVTALLRFAQALRDQRNGYTATLLGIHLAARVAYYWQQRPQFPVSFEQFAPTDNDVVHAGRAYLSCRIPFIERRTTSLPEDKEQMAAVIQQRRDGGLPIEAGWFEADLVAQHQFLTETLRLMTDVRTGEAMADFIRDRVISGLRTPSSTLIPMAAFGLQVEESFAAVMEASRAVDGYHRVLAHQGPPPKAREFHLVR